ncbi:MAG: M28 family peptidase, partial [Gemmatimonadota bacterium]
MIFSSSVVRASRVAGLALAAVLACDGGPTPTGAAAGFDAALADSLVRQQVAFGPRVPGTPAHAAALTWLTAYLGERAAVVETIPFTHVTTQGVTLSLSNVWARFNPAATSRILLVAHWDSRPVAEMAADPADRDQPVPGANDGASGVAVLLAIADALADEPPAIGVDILLTDGEDWGHNPVTFSTVPA